MARYQSQDSSSSGGYMDGVRVKISERYKPPPRINLAMSYAQRLSLNQHILDSMPQYEFGLEKTVVEKMREWRTARAEMRDELDTRLAQARELEEMRREEALEFQQRVESQAGEEITVAMTSSPTSMTTTPATSTDQSSYMNSALLIPTQAASSVTSFSNILTPIPLKGVATTAVSDGDFGFSKSVSKVDKSPFNISDFEADTSSPFDNMALQSINDMEELAQVLTKDSNAIYRLQQQQQQSQLPASSNYSQVPTCSSSNNQGLNYTNYSMVNASYQPYSNIPNSSSYAMSQIPSTYSMANGGYYQPPLAQPAQQQQETMQIPPTSTPTNSTSVSFRQSPYSYAAPSYTCSPPNPQPTNHYQQEDQTKKFGAVPDILRSLQTELNNTHISNSYQQQRQQMMVAAAAPSRGAIVANSVNMNLSRNVTRKGEDVDETFVSLPKTMQEMSRAISSMGFPLSRVARVCKAVGNDQKKVVEHLLAMSELLDLGFPESSVSNALLQCDNDRDKALDILIS